MIYLGLYIHPEFTNPVKLYMLKNNILKIAFGRSWEKTNKIETLANKMIKITVLRYKKDGTPYTKDIVLKPLTSPQ